MPAFAFTMSYEEGSDKNFVWQNKTAITSLKDGYTFDLDFRAKGFHVGDEDWINTAGNVDNNIWADYFDKFKWRGSQPPTRKYNVGAFFLLEYNAETGRFEPLEDQSFLKNAYCYRDIYGDDDTPYVVCSFEIPWENFPADWFYSINELGPRRDLAADDEFPTYDMLNRNS